MDWSKARAEYEVTRASLSEIARRCGVSVNTVKARARREGWRKSPQISQAGRTVARALADARGDASRVQDLGAILGADGQPNWEALELEYVTSPAISYRALARKYGIHPDTVAYHLDKDRWADKRKEYWRDVREQAAELLRDRAVVTNAQHYQLAEEVLQRIREAVPQLSQTLAKKTVTRRNKRVELQEVTDGGRTRHVPSRETVHETSREELEIVDGIVDRRGLKDIAQAVKDLTAVQRLAMGMSTTNANVDVTSDGKPGVIILPALAPLPPEEPEESDSS